LDHPQDDTLAKQYCAFVDDLQNNAVTVDFPIAVTFAKIVQSDEKEAIQNLLQERISLAHTLDSRNEVGRLIVDILQDIASEIMADKHRDKEADGSSTT